MKNITTIIFITLFLISFSVSAQNKEAKAANNPELKLQSEKERKENGSRAKSQSLSAVTPPTPISIENTALQLDENDIYQGRKGEFLGNLTVKELPLDFPKYEKKLGIRGYNQKVDEFYASHLEIVTPSLRQKLTGK
jgi:hypothetical protein